MPDEEFDPTPLYTNLDEMFAYKNITPSEIIDGNYLLFLNNGYAVITMEVEPSEPAFCEYCYDLYIVAGERTEDVNESDKSDYLLGYLIVETNVNPAGRVSYRQLSEVDFLIDQAALLEPYIPTKDENNEEKVHESA